VLRFSLLMSGRRYTATDVCDIAGALGHPVIALRGTRIVAANEACTRVFGYARTDLVARDLADVLPSLDRSRILGLVGAALSGEIPQGVVTTLGRASTGQPIHVHAQPSLLPASDGDGDFMLVSIMATDERPFDVARALFEIASSLGTAGSASEVRERTLAGFRRSGFVALAMSLGDDWSAHVELSRELARDALESRRPVFEGSGGVEPTRVYLPMSDPTHGEVLIVSGPVEVSDAFMLSLFADLASSTLSEVRRRAAALDKLRGTQILLDLSRATSSSLDLGVVLEMTADSLVPLLDVSSCFVMLFDEETQLLRDGAVSAAYRDQFRDVTIPLDDESSIAALVAQRRKPVIVTDTSMNEHAMGSPFVRKFRAMAVAAFPMTLRGRLEGVIIFGEMREPRAFEPDWVELAQAMVNQVGLSIANARLYESLKRSYADLETTRAAMLKRERLAALGELAAIVAHEVRNPLGVIVNATSSLRRRHQATVEDTILLGILDEECARLNNIVSELIDFARPRELSLEPEDIARVIAEAITSVQAQPEHPADVRFETEVEGDLPAIAMDRRLIHQAITNVAMNAIQSMPRGGAVRISASGVDGSVVIAVRDGGTGIPTDVLPRIFEPFFTTKAKGSGLGLAVVRRIVEDHRGRVGVESSPSGTTFSLVLPIVGAP